MLSPADFNNAVPQFTNGSYASNPINPQYVEEPNSTDYNRGVEPLQTLPAQWWNWFLNKITSRFNKVNVYVKNIFNELTQLLSLVGMTPDGTEGTPTTGQLKDAFCSCYPTFVKSCITGTACGCVPTIGVAMGSTDGNIVATDANGNLKPTGITVGTAAGCDASCFALASQVVSLGNTRGCAATPFGTPGVADTAARSDHTHPDSPYAASLRTVATMSGCTFTYRTCMPSCAVIGQISCICLKGVATVDDGETTIEYTPDIKVGLAVCADCAASATCADSAATATCSTCAARVGTVSNMFCVYRTNTCQVCMCNRCAFSGIPLVNIACRSCPYYNEIVSNTSGVRFNCQAAICLGCCTGTLAPWCMPGLRFY